MSWPRSEELMRRVMGAAGVSPRAIDDLARGARSFENLNLILQHDRVLLCSCLPRSLVQSRRSGRRLDRLHLEETRSPRDRSPARRRSPSAWFHLKAEVLPVESALRREADPFVAPGVLSAAAVLDVERDLAADVADGQLSDGGGSAPSRASRFACFGIGSGESAPRRRSPSTAGDRLAARCPCRCWRRRSCASTWSSA